MSMHQVKSMKPIQYQEDDNGFNFHQDLLLQISIKSHEILRRKKKHGHPVRHLTQRDVDLAMRCLTELGYMEIVKYEDICDKK